MRQPEPLHELVVTGEGGIVYDADLQLRGLARLQYGDVKVVPDPLAVAFRERRQFLEVRQRRADLMVGGTRRSGSCRYGS